MVWAGVSLHVKTNIVFIKGNLTAARYQHEVLNTEVIPLLRNHRGMQLLHDGAPAHRARATAAYLNANNVNIVDIPPKSPDLNIIEDSLGELNPRVRSAVAIPTTPPKISTSGTTPLRVMSMRRRRLAAVNSAGGHTCY